MASSPSNTGTAPILHLAVVLAKIKDGRDNISKDPRKANIKVKTQDLNHTIVVLTGITRAIKGDRTGSVRWIRHLFLELSNPNTGEVWG